MRLDVALVDRKLCSSRQEAQECILGSSVLVNGVLTTKQAKNISPEDTLIVTKTREYVSRGGHKLEGILIDVYKDKEAITRNLTDKHALDVGSSTGGFTDCLLKHKIASVICVDVGTEQLHESLRNNPKVTLFENTDIRTFTTESLFDIIVADLSFIPLHKVLDTIISLGKNKAEYFLLIKPQFEVGKGNTKKGIVKDTSIVDDLLYTYKNLKHDKGFSDVQIFPCHIKGGDGNQEYFLYIKK